MFSRIILLLLTWQSCFSPEKQIVAEKNWRNYVKLLIFISSHGPMAHVGTSVCRMIKLVFAKNTIAGLIFAFVSWHCLAVDDEAAFNQWLNELKNEAIKRGFDANLVQSALGNAKPIKRVLKSDRAQPEFKETYQQYINKRVSSWRIRKGRQYLDKHGAAMMTVVEHYGVPARFIAAIIGVETNYGSVELKQATFDALVTLAYDSRRGARFRKEIFAALEIVQKQNVIDVNDFKSSWAGALGIPQFMPTTFLSFAVDFDKDGDKDIWTHGPDLWALVANYLSHYDWDANQTWARKVMLPRKGMHALENDKENKVALPKACQHYKKHLQGWRHLSDWTESGVMRMNGVRLPDVVIPASLLITERSYLHGYLVYNNFCSLMRYNPSFKYALSVGVLADALK